MKPYRLTRDALLADLYRAYYCARKHKRNKPYQIRFEHHLTENLASLCDELWERRYQPQPSSCFIISDPKLREIFAADFRDRIVHHLYFNYVHEMLERTFIHDCYSCIKGRGTHHGIDRLEKHIRKESQNYSIPCYVLKLDIKGYFMHINRQRLLDLALSSLESMSCHRISQCSSLCWADCVDMDFLRYLTPVLILQNPVDGCIMRGLPTDWNNLPDDKSLFHSPPGSGLPIGNLTSQLFSNVYLNHFDQYMKRTLRCRHYGRYVDDSFVVSSDPNWLHGLIPKAREFLRSELSLTLHEGKIAVCNISQGVEFLGAFLKPHRRYISNATLHRMLQKLPRLEQSASPDYVMSAINSYLGVLSHYRGLGIQFSNFMRLSRPWRFGRFIRRKRGLMYLLENVAHEAGD